MLSFNLESMLFIRNFFFLFSPCSGSRSGHIHHHDVRVAQHQQGNLAGHTQEVCGLKWSPDGAYLASGGNDNLLNIWPADPGRHISQAQPLYTLTHHQAAVKVKRFILNFLLKSKNIVSYIVIWSGFS